MARDSAPVFCPACCPHSLLDESVQLKWLCVGTGRHQRDQKKVHRAQETCGTREEAGETEMLSRTPLWAAKELVCCTGPRGPRCTWCKENLYKGCDPLFLASVYGSKSVLTGGSDASEKFTS